MPSINKVILIGNLGKDPEIRYAASGAAFCNISVATSRSWKDKISGEKREETEWHRVTFYDRLAEIAGQFLRKGRTVYIEGRIKTSKYVDKTSGVEKFSTEIIADNMQLLDRDDAPAADNSRQPAPAEASPRPPQRPPQRPAASAGRFQDMDNDIPF